MKLKLGIAVALLALGLPLIAQAEPAARQTADVFKWDDVNASPTTNPPTVVGNASLVRTGAEGLAAGGAEAGTLGDLGPAGQASHRRQA